MKRFFVIYFVFISLLGFSQVANPDTSGGMGVAVSPSSMHLSIKPGKSEIKEVTVNNDTKNSIKFNVGFSDFVMGENGKPSNSPNTSKFAFSKYITVTPTYFELKPGEKRKVKLLITIPDTAVFALWTILTIDQTIDRPKLDVEPNDKTIAMGVTNTMGFGVYLYQNPPNVVGNNVDIQKFSLDTANNKKVFTLQIKNIGDGIGYSSAYIDITSLKTGKIFKINAKKITILPRYTRLLKFDLPNDIEKGKYSAVGVLDFGSKEEIKAAELEFDLN